MNTLPTPLKSWPLRQPMAFLILAVIAWFGLYQTLIPVSETLVAALPVDRSSHLGGALQFFFYDTPKVLMLLTGVVFVMGMVNSYFTPERTRALLAGRSEGAANVMAASLGIVTPFCSCSAVPLFIGFVQAGMPLGVTFSFLISASMVNEVALTLLFGLFGWKVALLYLGLGLTVAIVAGWIIGRLKMEAYLEDWVRDMPKASAQFEDAVHPLPHALYVALARKEALAPSLAGQTLRLADWYVRLKDGEPETVVNETYGVYQIDTQGRVKVANVPADAGWPTVVERERMRTLLFAGESTGI